MEELKNAKSDISSGKTKPAQEEREFFFLFEKEDTYTEVPIFDEDDPKEESV